MTTFKITMTDKATNETRSFDWSADNYTMDSAEFMWYEGNMSCDCNKHNFFERVKVPDYDAEHPCSDVRYVVDKIECLDEQAMFDACCSRHYAKNVNPKMFIGSVMGDSNGRYDPKDIEAWLRRKMEEDLYQTATFTLVPRFSGDFKDAADVYKQFDIEPVGEIFLAHYETPPYEGYAFVLVSIDGTLYEVHGSHCSCHGLENQWEPEECDVAALRHRATNGKVINEELSRSILEFLDDIARQMVKEA